MELLSKANAVLEAMNMCYQNAKMSVAAPRVYLEDVKDGSKRQAYFRALAAARRSLVARRNLGLTGVPAAQELLKMHRVETYGCKADHAQVNFEASRIDEPGHAKIVPLAEALPWEERAYYEEEANVIDWFGKSEVLRQEIEDHYAFVGGRQLEWVAYLLRGDLPPMMWCYMDATEICSTAGVSAPKRIRAASENS